MPYGPIEPPPLGIASLVAVAGRAGLSAKAVYPTFRFAEKVGYFTYNAVSKAIPGPQIAEWTFSASAFPDFETDTGEFFDRYLAWEREHNRERYDLLFRDEAAFRATCLAIREAAAVFVPETANAIMELEPRIVGCSSMYHQNCASLALLRAVKERDERVVTLLGGANCESPMGSVMKRAFPWVDFVVSGEAEDLFAPFCRDLLTRGPDIPPHDLPHGVIGEGVSDLDAPVAVVHELANLPVPDYDDYQAEREGFCYGRLLSTPSLSFETSRGCWWGEKRQCVFCGVNGGKIGFRAKPPGQILREIEALSDRYGISNFIASDNILAMSHFDTVLNRLAAREQPEFSFFFELKSNLNEQHLKLLAGAGVHRIQPGIEGLHDAVLQCLNKGGTAVGNVALLKYAHENGIRVTWLMLTDIPGEHDKWYEETAELLPLLTHLQPPHLVKSINYDRFSDYHRRPAHYGLLLEPLRWYPYIVPLASEDLERFACRFEDRNGLCRTETPGKKALKDGVFQWMQTSVPSEPDVTRPELTVRTEDGRSLIRDTRPCAAAEKTTLEGIAHRVYRVCHAPRSRQGIDEALLKETGAATDPGSVDDAIAFLVERGLLLHTSNRYLSLALREPARPFVYPPQNKFARLQATLSDSGKSYWEVLSDLEGAVRARHFAALLGGP
jgi:magnesium-protoporphyrin IX monomethyl ester (oxidative) cyclase